MKIRNGFVSNSSSSSFICEVCGRQETGYDIGLCDVEMYQCINGHVFCQEEAVEDYTLKQVRDYFMDDCDDAFKKKLEEEINKFGENAVPSDELKEYIFEFIYDDEVPDFMCPICCVKHIRVADKYNYLLKRFGIKDEEVIEEFKKRYNHLDNFYKED